MSSEVGLFRTKFQPGSFVLDWADFSYNVLSSNSLASIKDTLHTFMFSSLQHFELTFLYRGVIYVSSQPLTRLESLATQCSRFYF